MTPDKVSNHVFHICSIPSKEHCHFLIEERGGSEVTVYVLCGWRLYVYEVGPSCRIESQEIHHWNLMKIFHVPHRGCDLFKIQDDIGILTDVGIYKVSRFKLDDSDDIFATASTSNVQKKKEIFSKLSPSDLVFQAPLIVSVGEINQGLVICSSGNHGTYRVSVISYGNHKFETVYSVGVTCNQLFALERHFASETRMHSNPVIKIISPSSGPRKISRELFISLFSQYVSDIKSFVILFGHPDGRLLFCIPKQLKVVSTIKEGTSSNDQCIGGGCNILCDLGQPIIGIEFLSSSPGLDTYDYFLVIGSKGRIMLISTSKRKNGKSLLPEFSNPTCQKDVNYSEFQIPGPISTYSLCNNILVHCTSSDKGNWTWLTCMIKSDNEESFKLKSSKIDLVNVCSLKLFQIGSKFPEHALIFRQTCGNLHHWKIPQCLMSGEAAKKNNSGLDLRTSLQALHKPAERIQSLQSEKQNVERDIEELSTVLDLMNFQKAKKLLSISFSSNQVCGHRDEIFLQFEIKNNSSLCLRANSWNFCSSVTDSTKVSLINFSSPVLSDLRPSSSHRMCCILKSSSQHRLKLPLLVKVGAMYKKQNSHPHYILLSVHEVSLLDLLHQNADFGNQVTTDVARSLYELAVKRPGFSSHRVHCPDKKSSIHKLILKVPILPAEQTSKGSESLDDKSFFNVIFNKNKILLSQIQMDPQLLNLVFFEKPLKVSLASNGGNIVCAAESSSIYVLQEFMSSVESAIKCWLLEMKIRSQSSHCFEKNHKSHIQDWRSNINIILSHEKMKSNDIFAVYCEIRNGLNHIFPIN